MLPSLDHWSVWSSLDYWSVWPLLDYWFVWPLVSLIIVWPLVSLAIVWSVWPLLDTGQFDHCLTLVSLAIAWHWSVWPLLDTGQFGHCLTLVSLAIAWHWSVWPLLDTGQFDHCLTIGQFSHCLTTGLFREPTHNSHWHRFGHIETWAQRDVGTKRRWHKIPLFWAQRDVGTKYHFPGHIETWAQRDVGTKRCFATKLAHYDTQTPLFCLRLLMSFWMKDTHRDSDAFILFTSAKVPSASTKVVLDKDPTIFLQKQCTMCAAFAGADMSFLERLMSGRSLFPWSLAFFLGSVQSLATDRFVYKPAIYVKMASFR